jgi:hypothetical protein
MAMWRVRTEGGDRVRLTYVASIRAGTPEQDCGNGDAALVEDLKAFASDQAAPGDIVETPHGTFVRQSTPAFGARA